MRSTQNQGPAYSRNQGALSSSGRVLWFLDSDVKIEGKDLLLNMTGLLSTEDGPAAVGGIYEIFGEESAYLIPQIFSNFILFERNTNRTKIIKIKTKLKIKIE